MMTEEIEIALIRKHMTKKELAEKCGWNPTNLAGKMFRDNFRVTDLQKIADAMGVDLQVRFVEKDGTPIS